MTLARQLFTGITAAFIVLLIGIEMIYVSNARVHLAQQLDAHANDTATSLALSLGSRMSGHDVTLINVIVNPVFDRGHFAAIEVRSAEGKALVARRMSAATLEVPEWFAGLVQLEAPTGTALISSGWRQLGRVIVQVHPGYAYRQLWETAQATLAWLALLFAAGLVAMHFYLRGILRPLGAIERAAVAISNRDFAPIEVKPGTRELQRVTEAMNSLAAKIREAMAHESARAEKLRREAFEDPLTGQLNRRGFDQRLAALLAEGSEVQSGVLGLFSLAGLEEINKTFGLERGNEVLQELGERLAQPAETFTAVVGRWQGPVLVAFLPDATPEQASRWAETVLAEFVGQLRLEHLPEAVRLSCGLATLDDADDSLVQLGERAEAALALAVQRGGGIMTARQELRQGAAEVREQVEQALAAGRIALLGQNVHAIADSHVLQLEILASLVASDGRPIPAAVFVPVASQHNLLPALDARVIEKTLAATAGNTALPREISINVALQSAADAGFRTALRQMLKANGTLAPRLVFEITGMAASRSAALAADFAAELKRLGARLALDNFELDRDSMRLVHQLLPAYVKLAPALTREIGSRDDQRFMIEAMLRMLQPLEIPLIAQGIEDEATVQALAALGITAWQGYHGGRPGPLPGTVS